MSKTILSLVLTIFLVGLVSADSCSVSGANYCNEDTNTFGDATARAQVFFSLTDDKGNQPEETGFAVGKLKVKPIGFIGDDFIRYENAGSWDDIDNKCDSSGCSGGSFQSVRNGQIVLASQGETYNKCLAFVAWDRKDTNDYFSWTWTGYGWTDGRCLNIQVVECTENSDCFGSDICQSNYCENLPPECVVDSDCGSTSQGEQFCSNDELHQPITRNICSTGQCFEVEEDSIIEQCQFGCGEIPCEGEFCIPERTIGCLQDPNVETPESNFAVIFIIAVALVLFMLNRRR